MRAKPLRQANAPDRAVIGKILKTLSRDLPLLALSLLLSVAVVSLTLYVPVLIGRAIDLIAGKGNVQFSAIWGILAESAAVAGATALCMWLMNAVNNRVTYRAVKNLRTQAFEKLEILPLRYLDTHAYGEIVSRVITDVDQLADGLLLGFSQLFTGAITILGTLLFMLVIDWKIGLMVILLTPLSLISARFIANRTYRMFRVQSDTRAEQTGFIDEMLKNQKTVLAFSHGRQAEEQFDEINERLAQSYLKATFYSSITNPTTRFVNALVYAGVGLLGALTVVSTGGVFSVGQLAAFLSYAAQYTKPFNEISGVVTELQNAFACAGRIFALIEEQPQTPEKPDAKQLAGVAGDIVFDRVSFSYTPEKPFITGLNLAAKPGQRIALVGPTGCGKTTIINLLMRFYDVDGGAVRVDGNDIRNVTRESLRNGCGMVLQETWLKEGTIRENITLAKPDATDEEIIAAAKASHAHSFIKRLPQGYDTAIGEDGGNLSQGQKQLLCITRVMLRLPPVLILDEATSSIDTRTEQKVQSAFARLMEGRTSIVVAHRLSTIREADLILVMRNGGVIERGTHEELLRQGGFYSSLYQSQFVIPTRGNGSR
ncbi:MAG: ABC transporter ATP-binding protein [Christensenella sp.]|nr:ABC transporter ATP-binding protein [Christensenella sp.]